MDTVLHLGYPNILFKAVEAILENRPTFDSLEVAGVTCVLSKAVQKLSVIQRILPNPDFSHTYESMSLRMTKLKKITLPENQEDEDILKLKHIQKCRLFLQNVLEETLLELNLQGTYHFMDYILCCENFRNYDNIYLEYEFKELNFLVEYLKQNIISTRKSFHKILPYLSALNSPCSEQSIVSIMIQSEIQKMNTEFNEQARTDQNRYRIQEKERLKRKAIDDLLLEEKAEHIISFELGNQIIKNTLKLQKKLTRWTARYNNEIELLDVALLQTKSRLEAQRDEYDKILQKYTDRQEVMSIWREETDIIDRELELNRLRVRAATKIQFWWRTILFQRLLSKRMPFKNLKKRKSTSKKRLKKK